ncbi:protein vav isoform X1 [Schistocerca gregaria]|uniref:protein vav isoform X1 n=1 Tax=Schistocerca gregaria TaxID=7010 RepID=UPI00211DFB27|nr:protein vav isoform X1 [Schistocerca gregaria]
MAVQTSNEPWKECSKWLVRCDVLRPDHKTNWLDASVHDLAYTLRDGVLLCNLLNTLEPGCIDIKDVNRKPQMAQFLCLRNIKTFLQTCQDCFGLKESDLFEPSQLFDLTDFYQVLNTLSKLSNCPKVQRKNIIGFSIHRNRSVSQEDIYKHLQTNNTSVIPTVSNISGESSDRSWMQFTIKCTYFEDKEEAIYEDLCYVTISSSPPEIPATVTHSFEKRDYIINELVETEKNYVEVLATVQRCFMRPLSGVLTGHDSKIIFGSIKDLAEIHAGFHSQLRKAITPGTSNRLSDVFLNWREKFLVYGEYCANLTKAQNHIQDLCHRNHAIDQEVIKCEQEANKGKFKLRDILSVPMQRILKYPLLLEKLISETQINHEDYRGLERAKEAMVDVAQYINEVKRDSDTLNIVQDIQDSISDLNLPENKSLKDYGRLLYDGEMRIKAHDDQKVKCRYVFIFDKIILLCKQIKSTRGDLYAFREYLYLSEYKVENTINRAILRKDSRWNYQWFLVKKGEHTAFTMYARTDDAKRKCIKAIEEALDNIEPSVCKSTDHKFLMHSFDRPSSCNHCSKFLKGMIFQGYRCEKCQIAIHKSCIPFSGRCGVRSQPPDFPPRPPVSRTIPPLPNGETVCWNDHRKLEEYLWFVGEMGRERATALLAQEVDGTYLLRIRPQLSSRTNDTVYALSLKTDDKVKHMKVYEKITENGKQYFLSESRFFKSIVELITCYETSSLVENFSGLDVCLMWPYRRIIAVAEYDYNPTEQNQLPLKRGCQVIVLSKEGDFRGWWKGKVHDKVGFFPKNYVRELPNAYNHNFT